MPIVNWARSGPAKRTPCTNGCITCFCSTVPVAEGAPHIVLETAAGSYPGRVTRNADSLEAPALTQADLVWAHDETCSYRRTYSQGADGLYAPDQALPACSDYLEP